MSSCMDISFVQPRKKPTIHITRTLWHWNHAVIILYKMTKETTVTENHTWICFLLLFKDVEITLKLIETISVLLISFVSGIFSVTLDFQCDFQCHCFIVRSCNKREKTINLYWTSVSFPPLSLHHYVKLSTWLLVWYILCCWNSCLHSSFLISSWKLYKGLEYIIYVYKTTLILNNTNVLRWYKPIALNIDKLWTTCLLANITLSSWGSYLYSRASTRRNA